MSSITRLSFDNNTVTVPTQIGGFSKRKGGAFWLKYEVMQERRVRSLGEEDPLEEGTAIHSSILAWEIPWTEEPSGPQSMGSQRVEHD